MTAKRKPSRFLQNRSIVILLVLLAACGSQSTGPAEIYQDALELLYSGDLPECYQLTIPPGYDDDLNGVLNELKLLIGEEEYSKAQRILTEFSARLSPRLEAMADEEPLMEIVAVLVEELPSLIILESFSQFQEATVQGFLESVAASRITDGLKSAASPVSWSRQTVKEITVSDRTATLAIRNSDDGETERIIVVLVEGRWVPIEIAEAWNARIAFLRVQLADLSKAKAQDPEHILKIMAGLEQKLDVITAWILNIIDSVLAGSGQKSQ